MKISQLALMLLLLMALLFPAQAQIPRILSYQGILTEASGNPKPDGTYSFTFSLYEVSTGGNAIWSETENLPVRKGLFSTVLGDQTPFGANVKFDKPYWLGIKVGNEPELSPRITLTAAGYSLNSLKSDTAAYARNAVGGSLSLPFAGSVSSAAAAFSVSNTDSGHGLYASSMGRLLQSGIVGDNLNQSGGGYGVSGYSFGYAGVFGYGKSATSNGVYGQVPNSNTGGSGVFGRNDGSGWGVFGYTASGFAGVFGSGGQNGVYGQTNNGNASGVYGRNDGSGLAPGVAGHSSTGYAGVMGTGGQNGVYGKSSSAPFSGVLGENVGDGWGVFGKSANGDGVGGETGNANRVGGYFRNTAGGVALWVEGRARVGVLEITGGADLSEQFEVNGAMESGRAASPQRIQPGLVVSIAPEAPGKLVISRQAYDHRVAGIISGAGDIKPAVLMNQSDATPEGLYPVALSGRVYCWADASNGAIEPGDLLTTSGTPGHAMKVKNHKKAQGAIIGKAMSSLKEGKGLVLVLVNLQ